MEMNERHQEKHLHFFSGLLFVPRGVTEGRRSLSQLHLGGGRAHFWMGRQPYTSVWGFGTLLKGTSAVL